MRLIEQQGLAKMVDKATASRLLRIMDNLPAVTKWHEGLTERQKFDWAAPTTVVKRCPVLAKPEPEGERRPSPMEQLKQTNIALQEENHRLKQREDGDRWKPTDTARDIATTMVGMFSRDKAKDIAKHMLEMLKGRNTPDDTRRKLDAKLKAEQEAKSPKHESTPPPPYSWLPKDRNDVLVRINAKLKANGRRLTGINIPIVGVKFALEGPGEEDIEGGMEWRDVIALAREYGVAK